MDCWQSKLRKLAPLNDLLSFEAQAAGPAPSHPIQVMHDSRAIRLHQGVCATEPPPLSVIGHTHGLDVGWGKRLVENTMGYQISVSPKFQRRLDHSWWYGDQFGGTVYPHVKVFTQEHRQRTKVEHAQRHNGVARCHQPSHSTQASTQHLGELAKL